jgi:hypothetical protein
MARGALVIRRGTERDVPTILRLIRGLADYERLAHEVEATTARVRAHGFVRRRYFETIICRRGGKPVGFALYFFTYSTFLARPTLYLEDLFVLPEETKEPQALDEFGEVPADRVPQRTSVGEYPHIPSGLCASINRFFLRRSTRTDAKRNQRGRHQEGRCIQ